MAIEYTEDGRPKNARVGDGKCIYCGAPIVVCTTKSGLLTYICPSVQDGGCNSQHFSRSHKSDRLMAAKLVTKWRNAEWRKAIMQEDAPPPVDDAADEIADAPDDPPPARPARSTSPRKQTPQPAKQTARAAPAKRKPDPMAELFGED